MSVIHVPVTGSTRPALVDSWNGFVEQYAWSLDGAGYPHTYIGRRDGVNEYISLHRLVTGDPPGVTIDHRNHDLLDCTWDNLRPASKSQQQWNMVLPKSNTSGFKGVTRRRRRWLAQIGHLNRQIYLGLYPTPEEAAEAYDEAALRLFGEFALTNRMLGLLE